MLTALNERPAASTSIACCPHHRDIAHQRQDAGCGWPWSGGQRVEQCRALRSRHQPDHRPGHPRRRPQFDLRRTQRRAAGAALPVRAHRYELDQWLCDSCNASQDAANTAVIPATFLRVTVNVEKSNPVTAGQRISVGLLTQRYLASALWIAASKAENGKAPTSFSP